MTVKEIKKLLGYVESVKVKYYNSYAKKITDYTKDDVDSKIVKSLTALDRKNFILYL
jgi:hypothetical protein